MSERAPRYSTGGIPKHSGFFFLRNLGQSEGLMFLTLGYKKTSFRCHMTSFRCLMSRFQVLGSYKRVSYKKKPECMTFRRHFGLRGQTIFWQY